MRGTTPFRVISLSEIEHAERNAIWMLLSGDDDTVLKAANFYKFRTLNLNLTIQDLLIKIVPKVNPMKVDLAAYNREAMARVYTVAQRLDGIPLSEIIKQLPVEDVVKRSAVDDVVKQFTVDVVKQLPASEVFKQFSPDDVIAGLSPEQWEAVLAQVGAKPKPKPKQKP